MTTTTAQAQHFNASTFDRDAQSEAKPAPRSRVVRWIGRTCAGLGIAFMGFDSVGKLLELRFVMEGAAKAGFDANLIFPLGVIGFVCLVPYVFLRTRLLGAVLFTGYLGGAVATHLYMADPLLTHTLFPLYVGLVLWLGALIPAPHVTRLLFGGLLFARRNA